MSANAKLRALIFEARDALAWLAGGGRAHPELALQRATSLVNSIDELLEEAPSPEEAALAEARQEIDDHRRTVAWLRADVLATAIRQRDEARQALKAALAHLGEHACDCVEPLARAARALECE